MSRRVTFAEVSRQKPGAQQVEVIDLADSSQSDADAESSDTAACCNTGPATPSTSRLTQHLMPRSATTQSIQTHFCFASEPATPCNEVTPDSKFRLKENTDRSHEGEVSLEPSTKKHKATDAGTCRESLAIELAAWLSAGGSEASPGREASNLVLEVAPSAETPMARSILDEEQQTPGTVPVSQMDSTGSGPAPSRAERETLVSKAMWRIPISFAINLLDDSSDEDEPDLECGELDVSEYVTSQATSHRIPAVLACQPGDKPVAEQGNEPNGEYDMIAILDEAHYSAVWSKDRYRKKQSKGEQQIWYLVKYKDYELDVRFKDQGGHWEPEDQLNSPILLSKWKGHKPAWFQGPEIEYPEAPAPKSKHRQTEAHSLPSYGVKPHTHTK